MSDIQEEQKRLYKIAEENDIKLLQEKIKEILDYLKIENGTIGSELSYEETHLLLDYITNLQEDYERIYNENCKLREEHNITDISLLDENNRLKEENIKLKELCDKYEEEHKTTFEEWKKDIKANKKAIEYINKHCVNEKVSKEVGYKCYTMADTNELEHLIRILNKGSDKE